MQDPYWLLHPEANYNHQDPAIATPDNCSPAGPALRLARRGPGCRPGIGAWSTKPAAIALMRRNNVKLDGYALLNLYGAYNF